jgi:hypothetical protein
VTDLPFPEPIFYAAVAVGMRSDSLPAQNGLVDYFVSPTD